VSKPEEVWYENGEFDVQGWTLTPPDFDPDDEYPVIVNIHGGPHVMWTTSGTMWHEFQTMAARGYVVFWCNFRGSTGYGQAFHKAIEGNWGAGMMTDIMAGVDHISEREYIDEDNLFVTGGSGGGFMSSWIIGHTDRFSGAVPQRGVFELNSWYGSAVESHKYIEWEFQAVPWEDNEFLWEQSPIAKAHEVTTPTLILHGDNDFATRNNSEMLYRFLKKNRIPARMVRYPREGHELSRSGEPGHVIDRINRIIRWFDGYSDHHEAEPVLEET